jgi:hypothetical protein
MPLSGLFFVESRDQAANKVKRPAGSRTASPSFHGWIKTQEVRLLETGLLGNSVQLRCSFVLIGMCLFDSFQSLSWAIS